VFLLFFYLCLALFVLNLPCDRFDIHHHSCYNCYFASSLQCFSSVTLISCDVVWPTHRAVLLSRILVVLSLIILAVSQLNTTILRRVIVRFCLSCLSYFLNHNDTPHVSFNCWRSDQRSLRAFMRTFHNLFQLLCGIHFASHLLRTSISLLSLSEL